MRPTEILEEFKKVESEKIETGKREEFHKLLNHLREIYLKES